MQTSKREALRVSKQSVAAFRNTCLAVLLASAAQLVPASAGQAAGTGYVYSANEEAQSLSQIDLASGQVTTIPLPVTPHNVQVAPDGQSILVVGMPAGEGQDGDNSATATGSGMNMDNTMAEGELVVLNAANPAEPPRVIKVGSEPAHVVSDATGAFAFVTISASNRIDIVDLKLGAVAGSVPTGDYPHGQRLSPDGRTLLVADVKGNAVSFIDTRARTETKRLEVGKAPVQVGFLADGSKAYVSLRDEDAVAVLDVKAMEVLTRIPVGDGPIQVVATPDGSKVFVALQGSADAPNDKVAVIDTATDTVIATVVTGLGAHGVSVNAEGTQVFVTNVNDGTVSAIDTASLEVVATYKVGQGPNGISFRK